MSVDNRKPLHPYEQSMLLVTMLFDGKNVNDILSVLPEHQSKRMHSANEKFLSMPRNERMTEIVFELRRMLLVDEHRFDWMHQSWLDEALASEPSYLRPLIVEALSYGALKKNDQEHRSFVPMPVIFSMFIDQLINTRQKTAIYDSVLMRLQSLHDEAQDEVFSSLGLRSLHALSDFVSKDGLMRMLKKRGFVDDFHGQEKCAPLFRHGMLRRNFVRELLKYKINNNVSLVESAGLVLIALYLLPFKHHWQRIIALGFHKRFGCCVEAILRRQAHVVLDKAEHQEVADFIIASIDTAGD